MQRLMLYSLNAVATHARSSLPIVLIFRIDKVTPQALQTKFTSLPDMPWMKSFPCDLWAKNCYLVSNQPLIESDATLDPLHALSLFLAEQQPDLFQHSQPEDKTINLLHKIAKDVAAEGNLYESNFTTQVDMICSTNYNILTKAKKYWNIYQTHGAHAEYWIVDWHTIWKLSESSCSWRATRGLLLIIQTIYQCHLSVIHHPQEKKKKNHVGRINWTYCLEQGHSEGLFKRYSTGDSLRANFGKRIA